MTETTLCDGCRERPCRCVTVALPVTETPRQAIRSRTTAPDPHGARSAGERGEGLGVRGLRASQYDAERIEGHKTLGDAYRHHRRDPGAFVAGVHYALDKITRDAESLGTPLDAAHLDWLASDLLRRAKAGEPQ